MSCLEVNGEFRILQNLFPISAFSSQEINRTSLKTRKPYNGTKAMLKHFSVRGQEIVNLSEWYFTVMVFPLCLRRERIRRIPWRVLPSFGLYWERLPLHYRVMHFYCFLQETNLWNFQRLLCIYTSGTVVEQWVIIGRSITKIWKWFWAVTVNLKKVPLIVMWHGKLICCVPGQELCLKKYC